jgi:membrane protein YqaA with SNARE-associated domain
VHGRGEAVLKNSPIRAVYDWVLGQAKKPYAGWLLLAVAIIEPCLFPLPPDALMIPMALARRRHKVFKLAATCTLGSLLGSLIGYSIGALAIATVGKWLITTYNLQDAFEHFRLGFHKWGMMVIIAKGAVPVIPVPFFVVTIASGVVHFNLAAFVFSVAVARGGRFFVEAVLLYLFGNPIRKFIEHYLSWVAAVILVGVIIWSWAVLR